MTFKGRQTYSRFLGVLVVMLLLRMADFGEAQVSKDAELLTKENIVDAAKPSAAWVSAIIGQAIYVRDRVRTGPLSRTTIRLTNTAVLRVRELTTLEMLPPEQMSTTPTLNLRQGAVYMFSREKPQEMHLRTPLVTGALRGTEFHAEIAANGKTVITMFDGALDLTNQFGRLLIRSGEQATIEPGRPPVKTAVIDAVNIIQWCLYYPGVVDPAELGLTPAEEKALSVSLTAYRQGDLPRALSSYPAGRLANSDAVAVYLATLQLEAGEVEKARAQLHRLPPHAPQREAIEQLIAAVKFTEFRRIGIPQSVSEWMAESYYEQSRGRLENALRAARRACEVAPAFGFARVRVAELEFSFGRTSRAMQALERGLEISPRHAQAYALQGFALSAENRIGAARRSFDQAIALDGALGNAWLGRGLTSLRHGDDEEGRLDVQTAAALEPNRSILRSYLGKAFSVVGRPAKANAEFERARQIDPADPTPLLYSAIEKKQENRYNEAIDDLERSIGLNDNRRVYRSSFLLDQDRAVRNSNLASIYQNDGLLEQSVREAVRAVDSDYSSAGAHLFLANSYNALRDPNRIQLRYETAWFNELLLSNLLSPVGGGPLSQFVSEQEYSKLFERDGLGFNTVTEYYGYGELRTTNSQYGTLGNISYAVDSEYDYSDGIRPNNRISRFENYGAIKLQVTPQDTLFFQSKYQDLENGDRFQRYDQKEFETVTRTVNGVTKRVPNRTLLTYSFREKQEPGLLLVGAHHEWSPGNHTLLLVGQLQNEQTARADDSGTDLVVRDDTAETPDGLESSAQQSSQTSPPTRNREALNFARSAEGRGAITQFIPASATLDLDSRSSFLSRSAELQQILTLGPDTTVFGGRYQSGEFHTKIRLADYANGAAPGTALTFSDPPARQDATVGFERINLYFYNMVRLAPWLTLTGGVTYDHMRYPENFRDAPINDRKASLEKISPKVGLLLQPWRGAALRAAYTEAINGTSFDESVRLEPTQVSGFPQAYRSIAAESLLGGVAGSEYKLSGLSLEQKLPTRTYFGLDYNILEQDSDRVVGVFDRIQTGGTVLGNVPSSLQQKDSYREDIFTATLNQLVGRNFSFGVRYRHTESRLRQQREGLTEDLDMAERINQPGLVNGSDAVRRAGLHELSLLAIYNDPSGFFGRFEANWYQQSNDDLRYTTSGESVDAKAEQVGAGNAQTPAAARPPRDPFGKPAAPAAPANPAIPAVAETQKPAIHTVHTVLPGDDFWQLNLIAGYRFARNRCELSVGILNLTDQDYHLNPVNPYLELPRERTLLLRCRLSF